MSRLSTLIYRMLPRIRQRREVSKIRGSVYFDSKWYTETYEDVRLAGTDPARHYYFHGAAEGREPGPEFRSHRYFEAFPAAYGSNPLLHCVVSGNERAFLSARTAPRRPHQLAAINTALASPPKSREALDSIQSTPILVEPLVAWQVYNAPTSRRSELIRRALDDRAPKLTGISIVMPVYNPPIFALQEAVESVLSQSFQDWELLIADDCSTEPEVREYLESLERLDERIKVRFRSVNGHISAATNDASEMATKEYITFLDNDDRLAPDALAILALFLANSQHTSVFYSDDAVISDTNHYSRVKFKPGWSPELLLSFCYISHLKGMKLSLYRKIGGCRTGYEGSQDHDLFLRATELAEDVLHIPHVLYERRPLPGSTAISGNAKPYSFDAGIRAVQDAFQRRKAICSVRRPDWAVKAGAGVYEPIFPDDGPSVAIVIPTYNSWRLLNRLLTSMNITKYRNYKVYIADNESNDADTLGYLKSLSEKFSVIRVTRKNGVFNFANINNVMADRCSEDYLLFLNDDTEVIQENWLSQLVGWAQIYGVGVVGARLLFSESRIQHGGISVAGPLSEGLTLFRGLAHQHPYIDPRVARNTMAVTAACMLTSRHLFKALGGFDETSFAVAYNDVDYCLRVRNAGYRCVYAGEAALLHHEGTTRGKRNSIHEISAMRDALRHQKDPYISPHLHLSAGRLELKPTVVPVASETPVSVLVVSHNLNLAGAPNSQAEIVIGLKRKGRVLPVVVSPEDGPLRAKYEAEGIQVVILDEHPVALRAKLTPELFFLRIGRQLTKLGVARFQVVYANTAEAFWAIQLARMAGVPSVWNIRESEPWETYYDGFRSTMRDLAIDTFAIPYRVVFVANSTRRSWTPVDRLGNFVVIQNALPKSSNDKTPARRASARQRLGIDDNQVMILNLGTICSRKNQREMIEGIDFIADAQRARCRVFLVGARQDAYAESLRQLIATKPWKDQVTIVPETTDASDYWLAADVFCFTSRMESYPRVILEAMDAGLPIVTTPVFGVVEQVREDENALFYASGDIAKLGSQLAVLIADDERRAQMANASNAVLRSLNSHEELLESYAEIFSAARESNVPMPSA